MIKQDYYVQWTIKEKPEKGKSAKSGVMVRGLSFTAAKLHAMWFNDRFGKRVKYESFMDPGF